jgi:hypothetical protein
MAESAEVQSHLRPNRSIHGLTAALVAFAVMAGGFVYVQSGQSGQGSQSGQGGQPDSPALASSEAAAAATTVTEVAVTESAPESAPERLHRSDEFFAREINVLENTFDFDAALVDMYGDSENAFMTFEFTPKNGFSFDEDGHYELFAGHIPKQWGRGSFMYYTNPKVCHDFGSGNSIDITQCGAIGVSWNHHPVVSENGNLYVTFRASGLNRPNPIHGGSCFFGEEITFEMGGVYTSLFVIDRYLAIDCLPECPGNGISNPCISVYNDTCSDDCRGNRHDAYTAYANEQYDNRPLEIPGMLRFTFTADYEQADFTVIPVGKEIDIDGNPFVVESIHISEYSMYFRFVSDNLRSDFWNADRRTDDNWSEILDAYDYILQKIRLRVNGREYSIFGDCDIDNELNRLSIMGFLGSGFMEFDQYQSRVYDSQHGGPFLVPSFERAMIEAIIIDGTEFVL